jgi:hypothetical protein
MGITAKQEAQRLILAHWGQWQSIEELIVDIPEDQIDTLWDKHCDDLQDSRNEVRWQGDEVSEIKSRAHYTWGRNYDVDVRVIKLPGDKGLAYNFMSGGGKHGEPEAYPWWDEAWFVEVTGTVTTVRHTYADIPEPEAAEEPAQ